MRLIFAVLICALLASAQQKPGPSPEEIDRLKTLADQVKTALDKRDLATASRLATELSLGIFRQQQALTPTPQDKLAKLEQDLPGSGAKRFYALADVAKAAYDASEYAKAEAYARELLSLAPQYPKDWNYGNAIFFGNTVLGRVALRRDSNVADAKTALLASGQTPGSPQLNSFGPNMSLAKDLLAAGEREPVLRFFEQCRAFWKLHPQKLDDWTAIVQAGRIPDFGANLLY